MRSTIPRHVIVSLSLSLAVGCGQNAATTDGSHASAAGSAPSQSGAGGSSRAGASTNGNGTTAMSTSGMPGAGVAGATGTTGGAATSAGPAGAGATSGSSAGPTGADAGSTGDVIVTIKNGDFWLDTDGNRIEAHGAGLIKVDDAWYWVGEDKSQNSANFKAVNCYRSTDLSHWEFRNAIITRQTSTDLNAADRIIERPKVVYNDSTKKYVMWLHWDGQNYVTAEAGVFTSDTVDGNYTQIRHFQPNGNMSRDDTLFKDDDGKAYFLSASNNNADLSLYALTDDYTDVQKQIATLWAGSYREAPAIMKAGSTYFIVNSAATNWDPNQQKYATSAAMDGSFSSLSNVGDGTGYDTQTAFIIPVVGTKTTTYIYAGDRWQDPDLVSSKYIWLPLKVSGTKLVMDWYDTWQLDVTTGEWSAPNDNFISQQAWSLVSVDSEETQAEDGHATNAFDGDTSTYWHTEWKAAQPRRRTRS